MAESSRKERTREQKFWIIKTTAGGPGNEDYWEDFLAERVVAIGWRGIKENPVKFRTCPEYFQHLWTKYGRDSEGEAHYTASTMWSFGKRWQIGDLAVVCTGWTSWQRKDVRLYGVARVTGPLFHDRDSKWFTWRRRADIKRIEQNVRLRFFAGIFGGSSRQTIHGPFSEEQFRRFSEKIEALFPELWRGVTVGRPVGFRSDRKSARPRRPTSFLSPEEIPPAEASAVPEGAKQRIEVNRYERDPRARAKCIEHWGTICRVCGSRLEEKYGEVAQGIIHVHHLKELSHLGKEHNVDPLKDLRPVCPNCHAVIHSRKRAYTIDQVKGFLRRAEK